MTSNKAPSSDLGEMSKEFLFYLGLAITEWAHIETELFHICAGILRAALEHVAIIYYRTPTLDARLSLTDELAKSKFPKPARISGGHPSPEEKKWNALIGEIRDELAIRRQLAHSPAAPTLETRPTDEFWIADIWFSSYISNMEKLRGGKAANTKPLKIDDVKNHIGRLGKLVSRLNDFRNNELSALLRSQS